jgi:hypothetical protein
MTHDDVEPTPLLSLLCQGGDDPGADQAKWRLALTLNKHAENIMTLGLEGEVEILVADRGAVPLHTALELTENARRLVKFLRIPVELAVPGPHALNAIGRRARGRHVMVADSDVFMPLETMARMVRFLKLGYFHSFSLRDSFFWGSRYRIPADYVANLPFREHLEEHIRRNLASFRHDQVCAEAYSGLGAGLLMSREMWFEATGLDQQLGREDALDLDLTRRLLLKYRWDDLENHGLTFFLMEHAPDGTGSSGGDQAPREPVSLGANPADWGLAGYELAFVDGFGLPAGAGPGAPLYFDPRGPLRTVREIVATDPRYRNIGERFAFDPHSFFCNAEPLQILLQTLQPRNVCEIGTWMGASARCIAAAASVQRLVCVDHWDRFRIEKFKPGVHPEHMMNNLYEQFLANAVHSGTDGNTCPLRLDSHSAAAYCAGAGIGFDLIYVDGDHTTVGARSDMVRWSMLLHEGGYLCGDDWTWQKEPDNVAGAVVSVAREKDLRVFYHGNFWLMMPGGFAIQPLTMDVFGQIKPITRDLPGPAASGGPDAAAERPLVSIFCTCKNAEATIRRHIEAVVAAQQQYENIEYVVQDGISTDATLSIFEEYRPILGERLKLVSMRDSCCEEGFWLALSRCRGDIVVPSLSDEELQPDAIPFIVEQFRTHPEVDVFHGDIYNTDLAGNIYNRNPSKDFDLAEYVSNQLPMHLAASFFRRSAFEKAGLLPYPNAHGLLKDDFFTWAYLGLTANIKYLPVVFAKYSIHENALSVKPSLLVEGIARRASFVRAFCSDPSAPAELQANSNLITARFYAVSIQRLTRAGLTEESDKYRDALAQLGYTLQP